MGRERWRMVTGRSRARLRTALRWFGRALSPRAIRTSQVRSLMVIVRIGLVL